MLDEFLPLTCEGLHVRPWAVCQARSSLAQDGPRLTDAALASHDNPETDKLQ